MQMSELRTELKACARVREVIDSVFDAIADGQTVLKTMDLKVLDLAELKDMLNTARGCIRDQYQGLYDAEKRIHIELDKTMQDEV